MKTKLYVAVVFTKYKIKCRTCYFIFRLCNEYIKTYLLTYLCTSKIHTELYKNETKSGERYVCIKEKEQLK